MLRIANRDARRLWLHAQALSDTPTGALDLPALIRRLGMVQLDTIRVVSRAHHHILWSRNQNYREPMLDRLLRQRGIFEHFTHDASVLPMKFLPMWGRQFRRKREWLDRSNWYASMPDAAGRAAIKARIAEEGALSTRDFDSAFAGDRQMWQRPPHKLGLDYMWYVGELATCHRVNFHKYYDLAERVFPDDLRQREVAEDEQLDWLCRAALARSGFATPGEVQRFWDATSAKEVKAWVDTARDLVPVSVETAERQWTTALAPPDIEQRLGDAPAPTTRLRILSPFDPVVRDRNRALRLFGFDYRIEIFVPAAKRKWGYYVYPMLEGDRFVGRIEVKADRAAGTLTVLNYWWESKVKETPARRAKLDAELSRMARFVGVDDVIWSTP
ncbi:winged helix-turn-helix domain-containing protein [Aliiroseovarius sp. YM-037]|uniref:winged helix-turn-helix domain-containing protein n=1 Tax=Aliiroseovarius sp. YM-037 TaxID=3341728 RepID=UPI003A80BA57